MHTDLVRSPRPGRRLEQRRALEPLPHLEAGRCGAPTARVDADRRALASERRIDLEAIVVGRPSDERHVPPIGRVIVEQLAILPKQIALAERLGLPVVATNDLHYTERADAKPHDILLCIQQQKLQTDTKRLRFDSDDFYLKTAEEMRELLEKRGRA